MGRRSSGDGVIAAIPALLQRCSIEALQGVGCEACGDSSLCTGVVTVHRVRGVVARGFRRLGITHTDL